MAETIAAIATPAGRGGIGIVRVSGPRVAEISRAILGLLPEPRMASYGLFRDEKSEVLDEGIGLYFPAPNSYPGEDVLELQGHGGPVVMDLLLQRVLRLGARLARPGEFSERAFLNGKLDLTQAEAIADLIDACTTSAARLASRTLQGVFSKQVHGLVEQLIQLRLYVESAIDFPEEEIDFLSEGKVSTDLLGIIEKLEAVRRSANTGRLMRDGMTLVIAGRPNAGKSSLLNALAGEDSAIVTEIPGTTRDLLRERIQIEGMPIHIIDTAGLRESEDPVELEGIRRARLEIAQADRILWVFDDRADPGHLALDRATLPEQVPLTLVRNKIDLSGKESGLFQTAEGIEVSLSAKNGNGIDLLKGHLKESVGYGGAFEGEFIARRRHLDALERALGHLQQGMEVLSRQSAGELLAEDLRLAQQALNEITGEFTADDLLGRIFSTFCIGK
ncbi:MAG: tRNA uridine-5-carboxymethylaminomethyl(34) synthesis GTPase MnmE [Pseudomonadota bacterium]